ncbi:MAG TPA: hypothetical protein VK903_06730 [Propionicimonas sp.]|nr:hypothetical protein [Propionicimonas sp.]
MKPNPEVEDYLTGTYGHRLRKEVRELRAEVERLRLALLRHRVESRVLDYAEPWDER